MVVQAHGVCCCVRGPGETRTPSLSHATAGSPLPCIKSGDANGKHRARRQRKECGGGREGGREGGRVGIRDVGREGGR